MGSSSPASSRVCSAQRDDHSPRHRLSASGRATRPTLPSSRSSAQSARSTHGCAAGGAASGVREVAESWERLRNRRLTQVEAASPAALTWSRMQRRSSSGSDASRLSASLGGGECISPRASWWCGGRELVRAGGMLQWRNLPAGVFHGKYIAVKLHQHCCVLSALSQRKTPRPTQNASPPHPRLAPTSCRASIGRRATASLGPPPEPRQAAG